MIFDSQGETRTLNLLKPSSLAIVQNFQLFFPKQDLCSLGEAYSPKLPLYSFLHLHTCCMTFTYIPLHPSDLNQIGGSRKHQVGARGVLDQLHDYMPSALPLGNDNYHTPKAKATPSLNS